MYQYAAPSTDRVYQGQQNIFQGIAFYGPSGIISFAETIAYHTLNYAYEHQGIRTFYEHIDDSVKRATGKDRINRHYEYKRFIYPYANPPEDRPYGPYSSTTPSPDNDPSPWTIEEYVTDAGTITIATPGRLTLIGAIPPPYIPLNWIDIAGGGEQTSDYLRTFGMVIYSNTPIDHAQYTDTNGGSEYGDEETGLDNSPSGIGADEDEKTVSVKVGSYSMPENGYYGSCNSSLEIKLITPQEKPILSTWRCKSATSNETGLPISSSSYNFAITGTGATFTTTATECGAYEIEVKTMFGTNNFTLVMNAPSVDLIEIGVGCEETTDSIQWNGESGWMYLNPGVYHFNAYPLEPIFGDYRLITDYHWDFNNFFNVNGCSARALDGQGTPNPKGDILEVTINQSGLYGISVFATCPELPNASSPSISFDVIVEPQ